MLHDASTSGDPLDLEHRFLLPDGSVKYVHVLAHAVEYGSERLQHFGAVMDVTERVLADEELHRTQAYLDEAEKLSNTGSWVWDVRRPGPVYWSEEMHRIHQRDSALSPPSNEEDRSLHPPEDWAAFMEAAQKSIRDKTDLDCDSSLRFPDGTIKRIRIVGHPVTDAAGDVVQLIGTTTDVTEQHEARAALEAALAEVQKSEGRLRRIINTIPTLVWSARPDGSADYFNERWLAYTGLAPEGCSIGAGQLRFIRPGKTAKILVLDSSV